MRTRATCGWAERGAAVCGQRRLTASAPRTPKRQERLSPPRDRGAAKPARGDLLVTWRGEALRRDRDFIRPNPLDPKGEANGAQGRN